ncbi:unnamed protein product [Pleuronectes platessa]|uniref:Uncharacterized protein n=1 Tax=Pleuronectes platessa TaxID=8262 RepID=A0A9N7UIE0_PLEPL|nr:unnamed protein product [Pleuronectes platessa]
MAQEKTGGLLTHAPAFSFGDSTVECTSKRSPESRDNLKVKLANMFRLGPKEISLGQRNCVKIGTKLFAGLQERTAYVRDTKAKQQWSVEEINCQIERELEPMLIYWAVSTGSEVLGRAGKLSGRLAIYSDGFGGCSIFIASREQIRP